MNKQEYREVYLVSKHWKKKRQKAFNFHGRFCFICKCEAGLDVHHIRYDNIEHEDVKNDLVILCRFHHQSYHEHFEIASANNFLRFCSHWRVQYQKPIPTKKRPKQNFKKKLGSWKKREQKRYAQGIELQNKENEAGRRRLAAKSSVDKVV